MSRMSKSVALVLISSSLILAGCPSPRRVEPVPGTVVPGPSLENDLQHKKELGAILAANVVGNHSATPLTTIAVGAAAVLTPDAHKAGVANQYVRPHAVTSTHRRYFHYYSHHNYYSPYYYHYPVYTSPGRTVTVRNTGSGFHAPASTPVVRTSSPSTSTGRSSTSVSSPSRSGGFGSTGHSASS